MVGGERVKCADTGPGGTGQGEGFLEKRRAGSDFCRLQRKACAFTSIFGTRRDENHTNNCVVPCFVIASALGAVMRALDTT